VMETREELMLAMAPKEREFAAMMLQGIIQQFGPIPTEEDLIKVLKNIRRMWTERKESDEG
jgi:hypothetical protein